jgi:alpha-tubulin suppressor-like RCC1 family protein
VSSSGVVGEATPVPGDHRFTRLSPSGDQYLGQQMVSEMCGVTDTQEAYCWKAPGEAPTRVGGESHFVSITSSEGVRCGIAPDGKGYCWGPNDHGQLGNGSTTASAIPVEISGGYRFSDLATAGSFTCGIIVGGSAYCWGYSEHGELGDPTSQGRSMTTPQPVSGGLKFDHIYTRLSAVCAITTDRITYCWGRNSDGELGQAERGDFFSPVPVRGQ